MLTLNIGDKVRLQSSKLRDYIGCGEIYVYSVVYDITEPTARLAPDGEIFTITEKAKHLNLYKIVAEDNFYRWTYAEYLSRISNIEQLALI